MSNVFKSVVAAVAVTACCLGNELPARANHQINAAAALYTAQCSIRLGWLSEPDAYLTMGRFLEKRNVPSGTQKQPAVLAFTRRWEAKNDCRDIDAEWKRQFSDGGRRNAATMAL